MNRTMPQIHYNAAINLVPRAFFAFFISGRREKEALVTSDAKSAQIEQILIIRICSPHYNYSKRFHKFTFQNGYIVVM